MIWSTFVTLGSAVPVSAFTSAELAEVLGSSGHDILEQLEGDASQGFAYVRDGGVAKSLERVEKVGAKLKVSECMEAIRHDLLYRTQLFLSRQ